MNWNVFWMIWFSGAVWQSIRIAACLMYVMEEYIKARAAKGDHVYVEAEMRGGWFRVIAALVSWVISSVLNSFGLWFIIALREGRIFFRFYTRKESDRHIKLLLEMVDRRP